MGPGSRGTPQDGAHAAATASAAPRLVSTLLGHAHVDMALRCLGSLLRFSHQPLRLRVHDDGSLTARDLERLGAGLADPEVVPRRAADERLAELLATRPATRAFRSENPLALKLLDVPVLAAGGELAYCDSDVLFLRPFAGLFRLPPGAGALCMRDPQNAYSVRSWHLLREPRLRLAAHLNSGVITFQTRFFDPDLVEWFLARPQYRFAPVWVEQTCWALLAQPAGCWLLDPDAVSIPLPGRQPGAQQVALHFVSPVRGLLAGFAGAVGEAAPAADSVSLRASASATSAASAAGASASAAGASASAAAVSVARAAASPASGSALAPVEIRSFPAPRLRAFSLAATEARRRLKRRRCR